MTSATEFHPESFLCKNSSTEIHPCNNGCSRNVRFKPETSGLTQKEIVCRNGSFSPKKASSTVNIERGVLESSLFGLARLPTCFKTLNLLSLANLSDLEMKEIQHSSMYRSICHVRVISGHGSSKFCQATCPSAHLQRAFALSGQAWLPISCFSQFPFHIF